MLVWEVAPFSHRYTSPYARPWTRRLAAPTQHWRASFAAASARGEGRESGHERGRRRGGRHQVALEVHRPLEDNRALDARRTLEANDPLGRAPRQPVQDSRAPRQPVQDGRAPRQPVQDGRAPRPLEDSTDKPAG